MALIAEKIRAFLNGEIPLSELGPSGPHDVAMPIYERACFILKLSKLVWVEEIETRPLEVQGLLKTEIKRLHAQRLAKLPPRNRSANRVGHAMAEMAEAEAPKKGWQGWQK